MTHIYLVRHAQSEANVDYSILHRITNMKVNLTQNGVRQAQETGHFFSKILQNMPAYDLVIWHSPFNRTRQTAHHINEVLQANNFRARMFESPYLIERNFGLVDADSEYHERPENQAALEYFKRHKDSDDEFFCVPPLGESPFDMALRMHQFYLHYIKDNNKFNIIVSHGASLRALNLMVSHMPHEKYPSPNPLNASVCTMSIEGLKTIFQPKHASS